MKINLQQQINIKFKGSKFHIVKLKHAEKIKQIKFRKY